jgi:hypothetical protein
MKGAAKNETIANKWLDANLKTFQNQFESVGIKNEAGMKQLLEQESKSQWKFFATGRNNCAYVMVNLETKKRHVIFHPNLPSWDSLKPDVSRYPTNFY